MEKLDVKSFGAVGNGVAVDAAAIQCAIDTCAAEGVPYGCSGGTELRFEPQ